MDMAHVFLSRNALLSPPAFSHVFFLSPVLMLYNHVVSCTSCRCPCADSLMFITLMFLSRVAFPHE